MLIFKFNLYKCNIWKITFTIWLYLIFFDTISISYDASSFLIGWINKNNSYIIYVEKIIPRELDEYKYYKIIFSIPGYHITHLSRDLPYKLIHDKITRNSQLQPRFNL